MHALFKIPASRRFWCAYKRQTQLKNALFLRLGGEEQWIAFALAFGESLSPGNEQRWFWGSSAADTAGSPNLIGIKNPAIDALIEEVIATPDRQQLIYRTRALDRVLLWNYYVIPHFHLGAYRIAYWNRFSRPAVMPKYDLGFDTWWIDPAKDTALAAHVRN